MDMRPMLFLVGLAALLSGCTQEQSQTSQEPEPRAQAEAEVPPTRPAGAAGAASADFTMQVLDAFEISGRGVVATGRVGSGGVSVGDALCLLQQDGAERRVSVAGLERFRDVIETASEGEDVGILFDDLDESEIARGDTLTSASRCR